MKSWLNSLILIGSGFSFKSVSVKEQSLLNQSNNDPFFAVSSLPAAAAASWWLQALGRHCCDSRRQVLRHRVRVTWRAWCTTLDVNGVEICMGQALLGHFLWGSTITIITPMCQARTCGRVRAPGPTPSAPKQWKSVHVKSITLSARDRHWQIQERKTYREHSKMKSAHVSTLTGSVPLQLA